MNGSPASFSSPKFLMRALNPAAPSIPVGLAAAVDAAASFCAVSSTNLWIEIYV